MSKPVHQVNLDARENLQNPCHKSITESCYVEHPFRAFCFAYRINEKRKMYIIDIL